MTASKRYEILPSLPSYGPMYIPVTDNGEPFYSEGFPVRFFKSDGSEWVANFKPGVTDWNQVIEIESTDNLLVIASGACYLMNRDNTKPIKVFGDDISALFKASNKRFVLQGTTCLTIIEADESYWITDRISWDGLKDLKVNGNIVTGLSFDPMYDAEEWIPFIFDLDSKSLIGGSYQRYENKKPWWKIW